MFCSAILNAARASVRVAVPRVVVARPALSAVRVSPVSIRAYSAASGLDKEEVQGRIMSLLQGYDKVGSFFRF